MKKSILSLALSIIVLFVTPGSSFASTIFSDNFESGSASKWIESAGNWNIIDGKYGASVTKFNHAQAFADLDINTPNYTIELDLFPVQGIDRTVRFRSGSNVEYDLHFTGDGIATNFGVDNKSVILVNQPLSNNHSYHVKVVLLGQNFKVYIDDQLIFNITDPNYQFIGPEKFYLFVGTGSVPTEVYFDNVEIYTEDQGLDVPLLKQTDSSWGDDIYDSANLWSSNGQTMSEWGCAVTSAAMVFKYHGLEEFENGTELDPGSLNVWLKNQPDGYIRNGLLNWLSLSRLSKQISDNNNVTFGALEYSRNNVDDALLTTNINSDLPTILEVPGHFVVAKGVDDANSSYFINDPYFDVSTLADTQYNNSYLGMRTYTPVNSDLSYMMFVINEDIDIDLVDANNNSIGYEVVEDPIVDPTNTSDNNVGSMKVLYVPKPEGGEYELIVSSPSGGNYALDQYFYDVDGEVKIVSSNESLFGGNSHSYIVNFDKVNSEDSDSELIEEVTYQSIRSDIEKGYQQMEIGFGLRTALLALLDNVEKAKKVEISEKMLDQMIHLIAKDQKISYEFAQGLIEDINNIKDSL